MRDNEDTTEELDKSHIPEHSFSIEDFLKIMNLKHPWPVVKDDEAYISFIHQFAIKVHELDMECKKLHEKLPTKQEYWKVQSKACGEGYNRTNDIDYDETFAPVAKMRSLHKIDVKNAFLHWDP